MPSLRKAEKHPTFSNAEKKKFNAKYLTDVLNATANVPLKSTPHGKFVSLDICVQPKLSLQINYINQDLVSDIVLLLVSGPKMIF